MENSSHIEVFITMAKGAMILSGTLSMPETPSGLVIFAHGSGSSRMSPRNRYVADRLNAAGLATLLFDLLTEEEALDKRNVFDIALLANRVGAALNWCTCEPCVRDLPCGLFGASTGAAAALRAAADHPSVVRAVVSRGGRPDLVKDALPRVLAPTLLIVGELDSTVLILNRHAARSLTCETKIEVVPGATHLFEEPGAMDQVVAHATGWFGRHLTPARAV
ncbi:dienelactone hydrolase family protein [Roseovarius sp.]|jgi:pimeloyl-ACP methyl ester carboxylesterase